MIDRTQARNIKKMNTEELKSFLAGIYATAYEDGYNKAKEDDEDLIEVDVDNMVSKFRGCIAPGNFTIMHREKFEEAIADNVMYNGGKIKVKMIKSEGK